MKYKYAASVPCYNVGQACVPVLKATSGQVDLCIVVDDGSADNTFAQIQGAKISNLQVLKHEKNRGKGEALLTAFRFFLEQTNYDAIISLDGDGQHDPVLISGFQNAFEQEQYDLVYGDRMLNREKIPLHRRWLNSLSNRIISQICSHSIKDSQCGFRLYSRRLLQDLLPRLRSSRYELETEILILAYKRQYKVSSLPISTIYTPETSSLSHHSLLDVLRIAQLMARHFFERR